MIHILMFEMITFYHKSKLFVVRTILSGAHFTISLAKAKHFLDKLVISDKKNGFEFDTNQLVSDLAMPLHTSKKVTTF